MSWNLGILYNTYTMHTPLNICKFNIKKEEIYSTFSYTSYNANMP